MFGDSESWVNEQINRRRKEDQSVCVQVLIKTTGVNVRLATPACGSSGEGRPAIGRELEILDLWNAKGLNSGEFTASSLIAFLKQMRKDVC